MKYSLVIAGLILVLATSSLRAEDRFEDKGYHGFVVRLDLGTSAVQPNFEFPPCVEHTDWKAGFAGQFGLGLRLGKRALLMMGSHVFIFEVDDLGWNMSCGDLSFVYYVNRTIYLQAGPVLSTTKRWYSDSGDFDWQLFTTGLGFNTGVGLDFPLSDRLSILPTVRFFYVAFENFNSKVLAFTMGIGYMP